MSKRKPHQLVDRVLNGAYEITKVIGSGEMGAVYEAAQLSGGEPVAIKVLSADSNLGDNEHDTLIRRFHRETQAMSRLTHPNTIRVFDFGETSDGIIFLVMELLKGEPLSDVLQFDGRVAPDRAARIGIQVCGSLAEAHAQGIVHRDLKPANIFLCPAPDGSDVVKVLDFGTARILGGDDEVEPLTATGVTLGTPNYMSPEQALAQGITPATDYYALGVLLYEMLSGRLPFIAGSPVAVALAHTQDQPPPLMVEGLSGDKLMTWASLVGHLLRKEPAKRPDNAEVVATLKYLVDEGPKPEASAGQPAPAQANKPGSGGNKGMVIGIVAAVVAAIVGAVLAVAL